MYKSSAIFRREFLVLKDRLIHGKIRYIFIVTDSFYYFVRYVHVSLLLIVCVSFLLLVALMKTIKYGRNIGKIELMVVSVVFIYK